MPKKTELSPELAIVLDVIVKEMEKSRLPTYLYTVEELTGILKVNKNKVNALINKGYLPCLNLGRRKVRREALEEFLKKREDEFRIKKEANYKWNGEIF